MTVLHDYWSVLTDPGHTMAEVTYDVLIYVILTFVWQKGIKRLIHREHLKIDAEHGVEFHGDATVVDLTKYQDEIYG